MRGSKTSLTTGAIQRGDIFLVSLDPVVGSETGKTRPCVVIQNDIGNKHSPTIIVACITSKRKGKSYPTDVFVSPPKTGLTKDSVVLLNQIRTVDKKRLKKKIGKIPPIKMLEVDDALKISIDL